ncbi:hypothetical protein [Longibacter sp.]
MWRHPVRHWLAVTCADSLTATSRGERILAVEVPVPERTVSPTVVEL